MEVPCHKCTKCLQARETDISGRAYAEALTSDSFAALTLTYGGGDTPDSQILNYRHVQLLMKSLRNDGYKVRYIVAGEHGTKRGRTHWHIILYFVGDAPGFPPPDTEKQTWDYWPHGFTFVQQPDYYGVRYVTGYTLKDVKSGKSVRRPMMSKKPPLGASYWQTLADQRLAQGLPFTRSYTLPGCKFKTGEHVKFHLAGRSLELAWEVHVKAWRKTRPGLPPIALVDLASIDRVRLQGASAVQRLTPGLDVFDVIGLKNLDRALALPQGYLARTTDGTLVSVLTQKGMIYRWPVDHVADALGHARHSGPRQRTVPAIRLVGSRPPF
jgi:hypothetical protein